MISMVCGSGFKVFSAPLGRKSTPSPHSPSLHVAFFIHNVYPVIFISLLFFTYLTATTLSTSFPVSCKELLPKPTPLTSADFKRQKYEVGWFRHIQHFLESWLVCALNECSTLLLHDLKLLDFFHVTEMCLVMK